jgi:hypothetical protein
MAFNRDNRKSAYDVFKKVSDDHLKKEVANIGRWDRAFYIHQDFELYKYKEGLNFIRVCPPIADKDFMLKLYIHRGVGVDEGSYVCLHMMYKENCPFCNLYKEFKQSGDEAMAKDLRPKERNIFQVLDTSDNMQSEDVLIMDAPSYQLGEGIRSYCEDPKTKEAYDLSDPLEGREISFKRTKVRDVSGKTFPNFVEVKLGDVWPIEEGMIEWLKKQLVPFEDLLVEPSLKEMKEIAASIQKTPKEDRDRAREEKSARFDKKAETASSGGRQSGGGRGTSSWDYGSRGSGSKRGSRNEEPF